MSDSYLTSDAPQSYLKRKRFNKSMSSQLKSDKKQFNLGKFKEKAFKEYHEEFFQ